MKKNTLIIFDWDDTLFPTSWLMQNGFRITDSTAIKQYVIYLKELDILLSKLFTAALSLGRILIITNANLSWINTTKCLLPMTSKIINHKILTISARDIYQYCCDINDWKTNVFKNDISSHIKWADQVISFGDAEYEYNALVSLYKNIPDYKILKTVKLMRAPSFNTLTDQIEVIIKSLYDIYRCPHYLDLNFVKTFV